MNSKKLLSLLLSLAMVFSLATPVQAAKLPAGWSPADGARGVSDPNVITILHTNDVHTHIDNLKEEGEGDAKTKVPQLRYSTIAGYKASLENVLLVDAGDHVQGTPYGTEDKGHTIVDLMNAVGYDAATLGNHEFDYAMDGAMNVIEWAKYPYLSSNFYHEGKLVLDAYKVFEVGSKKVALVGITTPESITKSTPKYFMNDKGEYVYSIAGGADGSELYAAVQSAIDAAAKEADYVIALGHLGVDEASAPWRSTDVIANTTGLTAFIDGHSHSEIVGEKVADKSGKEIVLAQTGTALDNVGQLTIAADGTVTSELLTMDDLALVTPDATVAEMETGFITAVDESLSKAIGATAVTLNVNGSDGKRSVRKEETNIGNFCADAFLYAAEKAGIEADVAFNQGGGIRATIPAGEVNTKMLKAVYPWGNEVGVKTVTGQELKDALEWSYRTANVENTNEVGGFLQIAGMRVIVNLSTPSTVQQDENLVWTGGPTGAYRVEKIEILNKATNTYEPIDLAKTYTVVSGPYLLEQMGDGYNMFKSGEATKFIADDYMTLVDYIQSFPVDPATGLSTVPSGAGYDEFEHTERINYIVRPADLDENAWWYVPAVWALNARVMKGTDKGFEADANVTRASVLQTLYNAEGAPAVENAALTDVEGKWWANAANWAASVGLVSGATFGDDAVILRGEIKDLLEAYGKIVGIDYSNLMLGNDQGDLMLDKPMDRGQYAQIMMNMIAATPAPLAN